jgi:hypothetical protein
LRKNVDPLEMHSDEEIIEALKMCSLGNFLNDGGLDRHISD